MSIIYDALKKIEKKHLNPASGQEAPKTKIGAKPALIYILIALVGMIAAKLTFDFLSPGLKSSPVDTPAPASSEAAKLNPVEPEEKTPAQKTTLASPAEKKPAATLADSFTLNGVFFQDQEGYALINNQIVKIGDEINGAVVENITLEGVELKVGGETIKLSTRSR